MKIFWINVEVSININVNLYNQMSPFKREFLPKLVAGFIISLKENVFQFNLDQSNRNRDNLLLKFRAINKMGVSVVQEAKENYLCKIWVNNEESSEKKKAVVWRELKDNTYLRRKIQLLSGKNIKQMMFFYLHLHTKKVILVASKEISKTIYRNRESFF